MDLPDWLPGGLANPTLETIGPRIRLRGKEADPCVALDDFLEVVGGEDPPGYVLSRASIEAEHARGKRLCWEVVWLREEVAQRRYDEKQSKRMK